MYIKKVAIKNFRALEDIEVEFTKGVNIIVGPNAVGKTTILEAVRLAKALVAGRSPNEATQTLLGLGAVTQHNQQQLIPAAIARVQDKPVKVNCLYSLRDDEVELLTGAVPQIVTNIVQSRMGGIQNPANLASFFSSPAGQTALKQAEVEVRTRLKKVSDERAANVNLSIDFTTGRIESDDPLGALFVGFLDQRLPPDQTKFSYFPADRALPRGEQAVQLGHQDAVQQLEAHNSQPQIKYQRLKNTVFSAIVMNAEARASLAEEFNRILRGVLKGKEFVGPSVNQYGQLTTIVKDIESGRQFDIDAMSSGEKGLLLTFLLISRTVAQGGIILLDEPELHLNPAVCKELLSFLLENYVEKKDLQAIICSHSPEILTGAFGKEQCSLFHLVSETNLTKVRRQDKEEISQALKRLGTSLSEELLYRGTVFVEGDEDVDLLEEGFGSLLRQFKVKPLGGRKEVEKQIKLLQVAEAEGQEIVPKYFIFDRDETPTDLKSTESVHVLQWTKRCLENYLIDFDVLTDLLQRADIAETPVSNQAEVISLFKQLAMAQLADVVIRDVYRNYDFKDVYLRPSEVLGQGFQQSGEILFKRVDELKSKIASLSKDAWVSEFSQACQTEYDKQTPIWNETWANICDGKRLFVDFRKKFQLKIPVAEFKRRVMLRMCRAPCTDNWRAVESLLKSLIS